MKTVTVDQKLRVRLPGMQAGDVYAVQDKGAGRIELVQMLPVATPQLSRRRLDGLLAEHALTPCMSWNELRKATRES